MTERRRLSEEERWARAYDGFDYDPDDVEDDPNDPFLAEIERYGRRVLDGAHEPEPTPPTRR